LAIGIVAGAMAAFWWSALRPAPLLDPQAQGRPVVPRGDLAADERSVIELFRNQSPAVVFITTAKVGIDWRRFDETTISRGSGSGFVWSKDGYIVTNDHVVSEASLAQVTLADQSVWKAELVGRASGKDLAVLKIEAPADRLRPILVGKSQDLQVGQKVFAIGNPFGLDQTLTTGIISALGREIAANEVAVEGETKRTIDGVIQTDAAINPGNSGGPLLDSAGRLIGVNTAIYSPSGAYAGVGFAIPVDTVNRVVPELIRHGKLIRPDIGIIPFQDQRTRELQLEGVLVRDVYPRSVAEQAGLRGTLVEKVSRGLIVNYRVRYGDLIVAADGEPITSLDDWYSFLERHRTGEKVALTVVRDLRTPEQRKEEISVTLAEPN
jgi:S1-C subfamily serine protease